MMQKFYTALLLGFLIFFSAACSSGDFSDTDREHISEIAAAFLMENDNGEYTMQDPHKKMPISKENGKLTLYIHIGTPYGNKTIAPSLHALEGALSEFIIDAFFQCDPSGLYDYDFVTDAEYRKLIREGKPVLHIYGSRFLNFARDMFAQSLPAAHSFYYNDPTIDMLGSVLNVPTGIQEYMLIILNTPRLENEDGIFNPTPIEKQIYKATFEHEFKHAVLGMLGHLNKGSILYNSLSIEAQNFADSQGYENLTYLTHQSLESHCGKLAAVDEEAAKKLHTATLLTHPNASQHFAVNNTYLPYLSSYAPSLR